MWRGYIEVLTNVTVCQFEDSIGTINNVERSFGMTGICAVVART